MKKILFALFLIFSFSIVLNQTAFCKGNAAEAGQTYEHEETRETVALVNDAAELVSIKGEAAFSDFGVSGSKWRQGDKYIFVLDTQGNMIVHPDPSMEGKNELDLKDVNGKPIIRGLIGAAMVPRQTRRMVPVRMACSGGHSSQMEEHLRPARDGSVRQELYCGQRHLQ